MKTANRNVTIINSDGATIADFDVDSGGVVVKVLEGECIVRTFGTAEEKQVAGSTFQIVPSDVGADSPPPPEQQPGVRKEKVIDPNLSPPRKQPGMLTPKTGQP